MSELEVYLTNFGARVLQDAMAEATTLYWQRRADAFEWARPRLGEFHGKATREQLDEADARCAAAARACRTQAGVVGAMWEVAA